MIKILALKTDDLPAARTAASIALDKLADIFGIMLFGCFALVYFPWDLVSRIQLPFILGLGGAGLFLLYTGRHRL